MWLCILADHESGKKAVRPAIKSAAVWQNSDWIEAVRWLDRGSAEDAKKERKMAKAKSAKAMVERETRGEG